MTVITIRQTWISYSGRTTSITSWEMVPHQPTSMVKETFGKVTEIRGPARQLSQPSTPRPSHTGPDQHWAGMPTRIRTWPITTTRCGPVCISGLGHFRSWGSSQQMLGGTGSNMNPGTCNESQCWQLKAGMNSVLDDVNNNHPNHYVGMTMFTTNME